MKVIHVIASIDPKHGGLQAVAMRLAAAQCDLALEVHVLTYGSAAAAAKAMEIGSSIPGFAKIQWHILPEPDLRERLFNWNALEQLRILLPATTFLHIHGLWEPLLLHSANAARAARIPYCICPAGMLDNWSLQQKSWKKRVALGLCYTRMLNGATFLHLLNVDEAKGIRPLRLKSPYAIIPNGVFPEEFDLPPQRGMLHARLALPPEQRYVLFLSRLHLKKGLDVLAHSFARIGKLYPDVDLVVAGPEDGAEQEFKRLIQELGIGERVHMTGPLYGDLKYQAMLDADCFCLPSRQEGFSMAIIEALACGTPVVITDQCHFPQVETAEAGIIVPVDPDSVAEALSTILKDRVRAVAMGKNGRRLIMENFTWPRIAEMTLRSYLISA